MRAFIAVFPPLEVRAAAVSGARAAIRRPSGDPPGDRVRWTRPENVHLTLKFLGEVREETLEDLSAILDEVCAVHAPFNIGLTGLGAFPSARRARIVWVGVGAGAGALISLATDLDGALASLGFEREERPYTPHLTLGRVRGRPVSLDLPPPLDSGEFRVRHVELVKSTLTERGAVYETIGDFALQRAAPKKGT